MKISKILVPTDFSPTAKHALDAAVQIAKKAKAELILLHVTDIPSYLVAGDDYVNTPASFKDFVDEFQTENFKQLQALEKKAAYAKISLKLESGIPIDVITSIAKKEKVDLIVMGTNGSSGLAEWVVGSVAEKIVRFAPCPVITLNTKGKTFDLKNIVFASDFTSNEKYENLLTLNELAKLYNAKLHLLRVHTPQYFEYTNAMNKQMKKFADKYELQNYTLNQYNYSRIHQGIFSFAKEVNADMVAMATHRRRGIAHLFQGSIAEDIVNHSKLPIFTSQVKKS